MDFIRKFLNSSVYSKTIKGFFIEEPEKTNYELFMHEWGRFLRHCRHIYKNMDLYHATKKEIAILLVLLFIIVGIVITGIRIRAIVIKHRNRPRIRPEIRQMRDFMDTIQRAMHVLLENKLKNHIEEQLKRSTRGPATEGDNLTEQDVERIRENLEKCRNRNTCTSSNRGPATEVLDNQRDNLTEQTLNRVRENLKKYRNRNTCKSSNRAPATVVSGEKVLDDQRDNLTAQDLERIRENLKKYRNRHTCNTCKSSNRAPATPVSSEEEDMFDELTRKNTKENSRTSEYEQDIECAAERFIKKN